MQKNAEDADIKGVPYEKQLAKKQKQVQELLGKYGKVQKIIGMKNPYFYRNKVHAVFDRDRKGNIISGIYEPRSHRVVSIDQCLIEDEKSQEIIRTIRGMLKSFKIKTYDEDTGYGLLRHVLVRRGFTSKEIMVVLVTVSPVFPSKNNFVKALKKAHPEITTIVLNVNDRNTSMVLGDRDIVLYGETQSPVWHVSLRDTFQRHRRATTPSGDGFQNRFRVRYGMPGSRCSAHWPGKGCAG